eukprot:4521953-Amphidinium_carterae.2
MSGTSSERWIASELQASSANYIFYFKGTYVQGINHGVYARAVMGTAATSIARVAGKTLDFFTERGHTVKREHI